jgi:hypothetical protein
MKALVSSDAAVDPQVEFIKIDDGHILVRTTRGSIVTEAIISTVPPREGRSRRSAPASAVLGQTHVTRH